MAIKADLSVSEIDARLNELERRIQSMRTVYELYFAGVDRRPPVQQRHELVRMVHELEHKVFINNTAQKFRLRSIVQSYTTYRIYWDRVLREIEEGTYKRDIQRAQRKQERSVSQGRERSDEAFELNLDDGGDLDAFQRELEAMDASGDLDAMFSQTRAPQRAVAPAAPVAPSPAAAPPSYQPPSPAAAEQDIRAQRILELQRKLGLPATGMPQAPAPQPSAPQASAPRAVAEPIDRKAKLEDMKRRLDQRMQASQQAPSGEALAGVRDDAARQRVTRVAAQASPQQPQPQRATSEQRVIQRHAPSAQAPARDEQVERVYRNLMEAKRRCNEPTSNLTYEAVARSMHEQRSRLQSAQGARDVDFKVVIKDGRAFLKPEPK